MSERPQNRRRPISLSKILAPLATIAMLVLIVLLWRFKIKWAILPIAALLILYYLAMPRLVRSRTERFNRESLKLIATGKASDVPRLARKNLILRMFGPGAAIDARLGIAYVHTSELKRAIPYLNSALNDTTPTEEPVLRSGLAKALFATGDFALAEKEGLAVLDKGTRLPELLAIVARSRIALGKTDDSTSGLLEEAARLSPSTDVALMIDLTRVETALLTGRRPGDIPQNADSSQRFVRAWIHMVRGLLREHRGDAHQALESFRKAEREDIPGGFASAIAREKRIYLSPGALL